MLIVFWLSVFLVVFSYAIYPVILKLLAIGKKPNSNTYAADDLPTVSVIIAAFDEERVIQEKLLTVLDSSYPMEKIEILVGSDASTDQTIPIVQELSQRHLLIKCFDFQMRRGKPSVVNDLVSHANNEILVLTDANVMFTPGTLLHLVKHFKNPEIGLVDTRMVNEAIKIEGIAHQEKAYISREVWIKNMESLIWGTMMGPFGGCYAIRRSDYSQVPPHSLVDDFYINMRVLEKGKKAVNELQAIVHEDVSNSLRDEFHRKVRIATGNFQNLRRFKHLLCPLWKGTGFAFLSHKVLRWFGPLFLILALVANIPLAFRNDIYCITMIGQLMLMVGVPLLDQVLKRFNLHCSILRLIVHFYSMNLALLVGMFRYLKGVKSGIWKPTPRYQ
ncbi:MAG: glycosyltransferase family 2 protein [Bacteroidales bacterium]|nr:glycosyltransferase family 2 protein [Bacteroidales bacterium]MDZ4205024.1 glycosyltransferase family 2 protein [Bacteroidales bacterium]